MIGGHTKRVLLTIDVGNTQTVVGVMSGQQVLAHWRLRTDPHQTSDELGLMITALLQRFETAREPMPEQGENIPSQGLELRGICVCSTVPAVLRTMAKMCRRYFPDTPAVVIESAVDLGVPIDIDNPREVGTDRVVNALALAHHYGAPAIGVDCGTATTYDVISTQGHYLGGAIAPGVQLSMEALARYAAQLRSVAISTPPAAMGTNTADALRSGLVFGFAAQVDGLVQRLWQELPGRDPQFQAPAQPEHGADQKLAHCPVVATGGLASVIVPHSRTITAHAPWLTLQGLALAFDRLH